MGPQSHPVLLNLEQPDTGNGLHLPPLSQPSARSSEMEQVDEVMEESQTEDEERNGPAAMAEAAAMMRATGQSMTAVPAVDV